MATLPTARPVHSGLSRRDLLGYIADYLQRSVTGEGTATFPVAAPVHTGLCRNQLLGYIADSAQEAAAAI